MRTEVSRYRTLLEWALSGVSIATIVLTMLAADTPVRDYSNAIASDAARKATVLHVPEPVEQVGRTAWRICMDHQPLAGFTAVATVLVLFMRRMR